MLSSTLARSARMEHAWEYDAPACLATCLWPLGNCQDNCDNPNTTAESVFEYRRIRDALVKVGTPMIFGIWDVGSGKPWAWAPDVGHYWRTGPDLGTRWGGSASGANDRSMSVMLNYDLEQAIPGLSSLSGPGS
jgi:hypothetical protein